MEFFFQNFAIAPEPWNTTVGDTIKIFYTPPEGYFRDGSQIICAGGFDGWSADNFDIPPLRLPVLCRDGVLSVAMTIPNFARSLDLFFTDGIKYVIHQRRLRTAASASFFNEDRHPAPNLTLPGTTSTAASFTASQSRRSRCPGRRERAHRQTAARGSSRPRLARGSGQR